MGFEGRQQKIINIPFTATGTDQTILVTAPQAMRIISANIATGAALADTTDTVAFAVTNKGQAGAGSTVLASYDSDAGAQGATAAYVKKSMVLNTTAANLKLAANDVVAITTVNTGDPTAAGAITLGYVLR